MKLNLSIIALLFFATVTMAQTKYTGKKLEVIQLLESKKKEFKASISDSLYLVANSDNGYGKTKITRGDQAEDIELQIFGTPKGGVAGPFDGESNFYLLKIISMDSLYRTQAKLVSFFPKGEYIADTAKFTKLVEGYIHLIKKGKPLGKALVKDEAAVGLRNKGIISYWENNPTKENFDAIFNKTAEEPVILKVGNEIQVLYVTEAKRKTPYEATVLKLTKKAE